MRRTPDIGTAAREDRTRIDFAALRHARRARVLAELERRELDACLLGREANARYVAGQRRLWTSNTRPYLPSAVLVRATGRVHVLTSSASTEDAPEDVPARDVYERSFDRAALLRIFTGLPGLADARRVAIDGATLPMRAFVARVCPKAEIVAAEPMMRSLRRVKLPAEIECIRVALAIAESALQRAADAVRPGRSTRELQAIYLERMSTLGAPTFAQQGTFRIAGPGRSPRLLSGDGTLTEGCLVTLAGGALWAGYEGSLARTWWCGRRTPPPASHRALYSRWRRLMDRLIDACRAGRSGADLRRAHEASGEPLPALSIAYAVGLGHEGPIAGSGAGQDLDRTQALRENMVVALRGWVSDDHGGFFGEELVRLTANAPEILTRMGHGPLARRARAAR